MKRARSQPAAPAPPSPPLAAALPPAALPALAAAFAAAAPFPHLHLAAPLPLAHLERVRAEVLAWEASGAGWTPRRNDLYSFAQSGALASAPGAATRALAAYLYSPAFRALVEALTGVAGLGATADASAAAYRSGDYLLCHDDHLLTRRVAFILYLTPGAWAPDAGGELQLFASCAATGAPTRVARALPPRFGSLALFEVTPRSFHQVAEVLEDGAGPRLSISGWFHGPPARGAGGAREYRPQLPAPRFLAPLALAPAGSGSSAGAGAAALTLDAAAEAAAQHAHHTSLASLVNPTYLRPGTAAAIAARLAAEGGALLLPGFLREEVFAGVMRALGSAPWAHCGPPVLQSLRQAYTSADLQGLGATERLAGGYAPCPLRALFAALCGEEFRALLEGFRGAGARGGGGGGGGGRLGGVAGAVRAFAHGDYTIITDPEYKAQARAGKAARAGLVEGGGGSSGGGGEGGGGGGGSASGASGSSAGGAGSSAPGAAGSLFEATLTCVLTGPGEWEDAWGGTTTYLTADEERESVSPQGNSLCLVAREPGLLSFVKHLSRQAPEPVYQVLLQYQVEQ